MPECNLRLHLAEARPRMSSDYARSAVQSLTRTAPFADEEGAPGNLGKTLSQDLTIIFEIVPLNGSLHKILSFPEHP